MSKPNQAMSLAQIVAALSVTYKTAGVLIWLTHNRDLITDGRLDEAADKVRRIGDADPDDFAVTERRVDTTTGARG